MEKNVNKINKNLIEKNEWDYLYNQIKIDYNKQEIKFHDIFRKYIKRNSTIFEIGCYPGGI